MTLAPISAALAAVSLLHPSSALLGRATSSRCVKHAVVCMTVTVALDRSGALPGSVGLHVEVLPNRVGPRRGVIFLVAGGPGQGSARSFDLRDPTSAAFFRSLFPGWTLVAYDDRGTGGSGLLDCPTLDHAQQTDLPADQTRSLIAGCADSLGPARDFYGTADQVEDMDAVRRALAVDRIAIYGVSYGTKLALAYATAHPDHVERLLLDSVVPLNRPDPFATDELQAMPATLAAYCPGTSCNAATPDFSGDVVALANTLAAAPLDASIPSASGRTTVQLGAADFLALVLSADLQPGLGTELPAAVRAARQGNPQPLLRLYEIADETPAGSPADMSVALYLATTCHDGSFPWQPETPLADRANSLQTTLAAPPGDLLGPFGPWALAIGNASACLAWPSAVGGATFDPHPLPDVPVLALSGSLDLRTPTSWAVSVVRQFPQGHLLVVPGVGHSVLTMDPSGCSQRTVLHWMFGATPPTTCPPVRPFVTTAPAYPTHPPGRLDARATRSLAEQTLHDAEAIWLLAAGSGNTDLAAPGLGGGSLNAHRSSFLLRRYAITPGLTLSGVIRMSQPGPPITFTGEITVSGQAAIHERLKLRNGQLVAQSHHAS